MNEYSNKIVQKTQYSFVNSMNIEQQHKFQKLVFKLNKYEYNGKNTCHDFNIFIYWQPMSAITIQQQAIKQYEKVK